MKAVVTGGSGFIGAYLVRALLGQGWEVAVVDNLARGRAARLAGVIDSIEWHETDVRDAAALRPALQGADVVFHLAAVNGTENFYNHPELVLDVGIRGALAVIEEAAAAGVPDIVMASSAEVYQTPPRIPTDESVPLTLPNSLNPRYSYGGSKIATELIAFNYRRESFRKVQVFRPHNIYGPDMGWKHVIPQFILRALDAAQNNPVGSLPFPIQGDGSETRAFCYVDDAVRGIITMHSEGAHREIYHIGNPELTSIRQLAKEVGRAIDREVDVIAGDLAEGGTTKRKPDIGKMESIGYSPEISLAEGLKKSVDWYRDHPPEDNNSLL